MLTLEGSNLHFLSFNFEKKTRMADKLWDQQPARDKTVTNDVILVLYFIDFRAPETDCWTL